MIYYYFNLQVFRQVSRRLGECYDNTDPFGGKNIIVVGDLFQLEPVNGHCIYDQPRQLGGEEHLWQKFAFCELTLNMRQGQDPILNICNNLREGQITSADLHKLRSREFNEETSSVDIKDKFKDAIRIYPTRNQAAVYNRRKTTNLRDDPNIKVYQIKARDTFFTGTKAGTRARLAYSHRDSNKCGGFLPSIELAVGSRIMVIRNSQNNRYLVNGSMGTVVGFNWDELARDQHHQGDLPSSIRVKFDDLRIAGTPDGIFDLKPADVVYTGKRNEEIQRCMLPIVLCWAVTVHKVQGVTVDQAVIYLGAEIFAHGQAYVALSRVRTLDGVAIVEMDDNKLKAKPTEKLVVEMARLRSL